MNENENITWESYERIRQPAHFCLSLMHIHHGYQLAHCLATGLEGFSNSTSVSRTMETQSNQFNEEKRSH
jgi:hypothetical protein